MEPEADEELAARKRREVEEAQRRADEDSGLTIATMLAMGML